MVRLKIFVVISFLLLSLSAGFAQNKYFEYIDSADVCITNKDWNGAEKLYKLALKSEPANENNPLIITNLATVLRYQNKFDEALENYNLALLNMPNSAVVLRNRATLFMEMDSVLSAYKDYEKVIELDSTDVVALYSHAIIAINIGDVDGAQKDCDKIEKIDDNTHFFNEIKGLLYKVAGKYREAITFYSGLLKKEKSIVYLIERAECYIALRKMTDAEIDIHEGLQINPENGYLYLLRAKINKMRFNNKDMQRDANLAVKFGVSKQEVYSKLR